MIFGRRDVLIVSLVLFAVGSILCGAAINIPMLLVGRSETFSTFLCGIPLTCSFVHM